MSTPDTDDLGRTNAQDSAPQSEADAQPQRRRVRPKLWHILLLTAAVICTFLLAWWQWTRFRSGSGTVQNLGYVIQWPIFGLFFVYIYRMGLKYENESRDALADDPDALYEADVEKYRDKVTKIDPSFLPPRPQLNVEEFNDLVRPRRETAKGMPHQGLRGTTVDTSSPSDTQPQQGTHHDQDTTKE